MLDVRRLRLLLELTRRGTITAVAGALAYTPSAVSQPLAALEREAGVPLLERTGRRVALTPAGVVLARYAESVLAVLAEDSAALAATRSSLTGPLRIGAFPSAARTILPPALVALGGEHPGLELMVTELDPVAVPGALHAGTLDVALTFVYDYVPAEPDPALDTEPLLEEWSKLPVSVAPALKWRNRPSVALRWALARSGPGATNHFEAGGFVRSNDTVRYPNLMFHFLPIAIRYDGSAPAGGHR